MNVPDFASSAVSSRFAACPGAPRAPFMRDQLELPAELEGTVSEVNLLLREPMAHVGLEHLDVFVEMFDGEEKVRGLPDEVLTRPAFAPAMWFVEITEGLAIFGAEEVQSCVPSALVPGVALAVTAAFAAAHGLDASSEVELRIGALTLGFGALLTAS